MTRASSLPPDYTIRQARNIDIPAIYQIILMSFSSLKSLIIFVILLITSIFYSFLLYVLLSGIVLLVFRIF